MRIEQLHLDPNIWRPQARFSAKITSSRQIDTFNEGGGIAVYLDTMRSAKPNIEMLGSQCSIICVWEAHSPSGFLTKPKFSADFLTIRFVTSGHFVYSSQNGEISASPAIATLTRFDELLETRASRASAALNATIATDRLMSAHAALAKSDHTGLPDLAPIAEMTMPGMWPLFCTLRSIQRRLPEFDQQADLMLPLLQEVMSYQLLTAWPKHSVSTPPRTPDLASRHLRQAIDYIEENLSSAITLAEVAAAVGTSVRSLQIKFRSEINRSPVQYIIERRLERAHDDLMSNTKSARSISDIARHWGFIHMNDFGQRYRRRYGCTPSDTRRKADDSR